jgi:beta-lactamase regulating signal transducer with metallopeptidase domain/O6-methylguanine-DNA--protein-cysteine methyltransferase
MNHFSFLYSPAAQALGYSLVYSLWQSFIIFICLRLILKCISDASSRFKYAISYFAHLGIAAWFVITFFQQFSLRQSEYLSLQIMHEGFSPLQVSHYSATINGGISLSFLNNYFPWLTIIYLLGIVWLSVRLMLNYFQTIRFRINGLSDLDIGWLDHIETLAHKMGIHQPVYTYISRYITTPMMVGFFRPVILLPLAAVNNLSPDQIEAILLHELAHIRRNDYLFNLIQSVLDTVLFFNPFAWWISKNIREEREKCCDEMVLKLSDPYPYARALLALEEFGNNHHKLVMAAVNKRSQLFYRIKNIMEMKNKPINFSQKIIALAIVISATISVAWLTPNEKKPTGNNKEIQNTHKTLSAVSPNFSTNPFSVYSAAIQAIADSGHPKAIPPLPPPPPAPPGAPLPPLPLLPPAPAIAAMPPLPPLPPLPPSVSMNRLKDSIPSLDKYFKSDEWKQQQNEIKKSAEKLQQYFKSPEWKKQQENIQKSTASIQKYFQSNAWKQQQNEIMKSTEKLQQYFKSPEWKKQMENIKKSTSTIQQYFNSDEWKQQQNEIKKSTEKLQQYFNSDEWKKQQEELKHITDSVKAYFNSDLWKKQNQNLQETMAQTKKSSKSDEWKKHL